MTKGKDGMRLDVTPRTGGGAQATVLICAIAAGLLTACSEGPPEPQSVEEKTLQSMSDLPQVKGAVYYSEKEVVEVTVWDPEDEISEQEVREYQDAAEDATGGVDVQIDLEVAHPPQ